MADLLFVVGYWTRQEGQQWVGVGKIEINIS